MFTIYLVDDEPFFLNSMTNSELWAETGFEVVGSHIDPREALAEIVKCRPHVVCTDMKMSYYGGEFEFSIENREQSGTVVSMTLPAR